MKPNPASVIAGSGSRLFAALCCAALLGACGSSPQRMGAPQQPYELRLQQEFAAADTSGDEQLTAEEFAKGFPEVDVAFKDLDTDGNGRVSLAEMKAYAQWRRIASWPDRRAQ